MSTHKTTVDQKTVENFLIEKYPNGLSDFEMIIGGESSQAYSFKTNGKDYIIRLNKHNPRGFKKDEYAFKHFGSDLIPIPKVYDIGKINDSLNYCITEKVSGELIISLRGEEFKNTIPDLFKVLDAIHASDISDTRGYGNVFQSVHFIGSLHGNKDGIKKTKRDVCDELGVDIFIDDSMENAVNIASDSRPVFLLDNPWNQGELVGNIKRVKGWEEVVDKIENNS